MKSRRIQYNEIYNSLNIIKDLSKWIVDYHITNAIIYHLFMHYQLTCKIPISHVSFIYTIALYLLVVNTYQLFLLIFFLILEILSNDDRTLSLKAESLPVSILLISINCTLGFVYTIIVPSTLVFSVLIIMGMKLVLLRMMLKFHNLM